MPPESGGNCGRLTQDLPLGHHRTQVRWYLELISLKIFIDQFWKVNSPTQSSTYCSLLLIKIYQVVQPSVVAKQQPVASLASRSPPASKTPTPQTPPPQQMVAPHLPSTPKPPWRQPRGKLIVVFVNFHTNATSKTPRPQSLPP
jgi:hypothetical protein